MPKKNVKKSTKDAGMIAGVPSEPPAAPKTAQRTVLALQALMYTEGWAVIKKINQQNIDKLTEVIIEKAEDGRVLTEAQVDEARAKRGFLVELMNLPENIIEQLQETGVKIDNADPFFRSREEILESRRQLNN